MTAEPLSLGTRPTQRRRAFTLVEMLVATALVLFVMAILTEAFVAGLDAFSKLKAIGDMEERLRTATTLLRRDLAADHFEGRRRLSDPGFGTPREGFFRIQQGPASPFQNVKPSPFQDEGTDADGVPSRRRITHSLHFTVKLRGNRREDFFSAQVQPPSPLFTLRTNFFDQPADARYQDSLGTYNSQWAEVAYWLLRTGTTAVPTDIASDEILGGPKPLCALYRSQFVIVPDNSSLNWPDFTVKPPSLVEYARHGEISCKKANPNSSPPFPDGLYFNNPSDLSENPQRRVFPDALLPLRGATLLLTDVLSFDVEVMRMTMNGPSPWFVDIGTFDTSVPAGNQVLAVRITIRVWDPKTQQARQTTIIQDL